MEMKDVISSQRRNFDRIVTAWDTKRQCKNSNLYGRHLIAQEVVEVSDEIKV
jgi:hypothetical protein